MEYLFVCLYNRDRSPLAASIFGRFVREKSLDINVGSAGILPDAVRVLTKEQVDAADKIFVMNESIKKQIIDRYSKDLENVINLEIPGSLSRDPKLQGILEEKLKPYLP